MKVKWSTLTLVLVFAAGMAWAHGSKVHIRGKVEKVGADSLQVKTPDGKSVEVKLVASTVYIQHIQHMAVKPSEAPDPNDNRPAKLADVAVGDAVVIHATPKDGNLEADEVKFSVPESNKVAAAASKPKS